MLLTVASHAVVVCGCWSYWAERRSLVGGALLGYSGAGLRTMALLTLMAVSRGGC